MAIKRVTYNTLSYLVAEIKDRYAEKSAIGALGGLDKAINAAVAGLIQLDDLSVASTGAGNVVTGLAYDNKTGKFTVTKGLTALTEADFTEITQQEVKAMR